MNLSYSGLDEIIINNVDSCHSINKVLNKNNYSLNIKRSFENKVVTKKEI